MRKEKATLCYMDTACTYNWEGLTTYHSVQKYPWIDNSTHSLGRNQKAMWFRVLKLIFVKRLIQRFL